MKNCNCIKWCKICFRSASHFPKCPCPINLNHIIVIFSSSIFTFLSLFLYFSLSLMVGGEEINSIHLPFSHLLVLLALQNVYSLPFPFLSTFSFFLPLHIHKKCDKKQIVVFFDRPHPPKTMISRYF